MVPLCLSLVIHYDFPLHDFIIYNSIWGPCMSFNPPLHHTPLDTKPLLKCLWYPSNHGIKDLKVYTFNNYNLSPLSMNLWQNICWFWMPTHSIFIFSHLACVQVVFKYLSKNVLLMCGMMLLRLKNSHEFLGTINVWKILMINFWYWYDYTDSDVLLWLQFNKTIAKLLFCDDVKTS